LYFSFTIIFSISIATILKSKNRRFHILWLLIPLYHIIIIAVIIFLILPIFAIIISLFFDNYSPEYAGLMIIIIHFSLSIISLIALLIISIYKLRKYEKGSYLLVPVDDGPWIDDQEKQIIREIITRLENHLVYVDKKEKRSFFF